MMEKCLTGAFCKPTSSLNVCFFRLIIRNRGLDCVFGEHGAVKLHGRQFQVRSNVSVLDVHRIFDIHAFDKLSRVAGGCDGRTATESLEDRFLDGAIILVNLNLEFHDISTRRCSYETRSNICSFFIHGTHISGVLIVVQNSLVVSEHPDGGTLQQQRPKAGSNMEGTLLQHLWLYYY